MPTTAPALRGEITVRVIVPVASCWMTRPSANLFVGDTLQLQVNGTPANATYHAPTDFTWESSDENVVTVNETGVVTGVGEGTAVITATSHNGLEATCHDQRHHPGGPDRAWSWSTPSALKSASAPRACACAPSPTTRTAPPSTSPRMSTGA